MSFVDAIESVRRTEPVEPVSSISALAEPPSLDAVLAPVVDQQPYATHASTATGYDRWPAVFDPVAASIAAAASAQHLKTFWQGVPPRERRR
jgi:hypothetical protein